MRRIVYDVAVSTDGFIAGDGEDISRFVSEGEHVAAYRARLASYATVIMGRGTYEFGYKFGMKPGDLPYPHMDHHVFSRTLELPANSAVSIVRRDAEGVVRALKQAEGGDIYLCGGGRLAGYLARLGLIDVLRLKLSPIVLGGGVPLFCDVVRPLSLRFVGSESYSSGVMFAEYEVAGE